MESEFIEPTLASKRKVLLLYLGSFVSYVAIDMLWPLFMAFVRALPLCERLPWLRGLIVAGAAAIPYMSVVIASRGLKILRSGQTPPPDTPVFLRTAIKKGRTAFLHAYAYLSLACAVLFVALYFAPQVWASVSSLFVQTEQCNGT